ncbi:universal stress protein [Pedobacter sp. AW31-3R]|uniref:universal stress protein n=1 Tax=Pedobacter sp. AW31-3R TaxID=3445781 RepID=UPI003FA06E0C
MKTVLVLTDFSESARVAADVAIDIAVKLNANIMVLNTYKGLYKFPSVEITSWTMGNYALLMQTSKSNMNKEVIRMNKQIAAFSTEERKPKIISVCHSGPLAETVRDIVHSENIMMVIMGGRKKINENAAHGSDINAVLSKLSCPTLIIPEDQKATVINRIVFATDLGGSDINAIKWLSKLSEIYKILIHVRHIQKEVLAGEIEEQDDISACMTAISGLNSKNISFQYLRGNDVAQELGTFNKITQEDILALVHKKHSFIWRLFHAKACEVVATHRKTPILIIPESW